MAEKTERWAVGDTTLTTIVEAETLGIPLELFYADGTAADIAAAGQWLVDGAARDATIAFRVQSFVIDHADKVILVDPCVGNHKTRTLPFWSQQQFPWMDRFVAAGFDPAAVDLVVHTHLHEDHIGWDTQLIEGEWVPSFPNARHVYVGDELDWASTDERRQGHDPFADSIKPIVDAGLSWQVDANADLGDGLQLLSTPGHTPGHVAMQINTTAEPLIITGDLLHHPFQLASPDLAEIGDLNPDLARRTRREFFTEFAGSDAVIAGTHFPIAPVGHIEAAGQTWRFEPTLGTPA